MPSGDAVNHIQSTISSETVTSCVIVVPDRFFKLQQYVCMDVGLCMVRSWSSGRGPRTGPHGLAVSNLEVKTAP